MKQLIRAFSIGLFTSSILLFIVFYFLTDNGKQTKNISTEEMITAIKADGYRVVTEEEYIAIAVNKETKPVEENKPKTEVQEQVPKQPDKVSPEVNQPKTYTLTIVSGMPTSEISEQLQKNGIIDDPIAFNTYLEENKYSKNIQLGTFEVNNGMSNYEIAIAITK